MRIRDRLGLTLVEVLIVLGIITIVAAFGAWGLRPRAHSIAAEAVQALVHSARVEAIKRNRAVAITFDTDTSVFSVAANTVGNVASCGPGAMSLVNTLNVAEEFGGVAATVSFEGGGLVWLPSGQARSCTSGSPAAMVATFAYRGTSSTVTVDGAGRVETQ